jgi:Fe-S cluster assembly protein SufD
MTSVAKTPAWLEALRGRGQSRFAETGLPTQRVEAWKYTGLNKLKLMGLTPNAPSPRPSPQTGDGVSGAVPLIEGRAHRLTFVDGHFDDDQSAIGELPEGVILGSLSKLIQRHSSIIEPLLGQIADLERRPMVALNSAWIEDGLVLIAPRGVVLDTPVEVTFVTTDAAGAVYPRHLVSVGDRAEAVLIERHIGGASGGFTDAVTEITLGGGANLRHYVLHAESAATIGIETVAATIGRESQYRSFALTAGGGVVRREIEVALSAPGAGCQVDGAYLVDGDRHADTTILMDHQAPHCSSRQTQKGVVDDRGHAVFQGKILVRPDAQKTDGYQLSQTILLSPNAEIDVKPELEIYADDVKCSHGATSGKLDADALFFLRARGIPKGEARALLIEGFVGGAIDEIDHIAVRDAFKASAAHWLAERISRKDAL